MSLKMEDEDTKPIEEIEGYHLLTPALLNKLQKRRNHLRQKKQEGNVGNSAAKQAVFKGLDQSWIPTSEEIVEPEHKPDPTLTDGQELPQYYGRFKKSLYNKPILDIDPYYKERGESTFCVVTQRFGTDHVYRFSATRGFFVFSPFQPLRQLAIRIILHPLFDAIVMTTILVNCVFLGLNEEIAAAEYLFTALYTFEMVVKMVGRGFILNPFTYLRDPWNWLDFIVVIIAYATILGSASNVSSLRTFRVVRAFKSVSIVPGLRTIVNALFHSMKPLAEVMFIMCFLLIVVSLIALQAYQGVLRRRCVKHPPSGLSEEAYFNYTHDKANWNDVDGEKVVCGNSTGSGICPASYICLSDVSENPNYGHTNFDHMGYALLTSFQLLTLDYWENVYNMIIRAEGPWNILFFFMSVFLGPFYLLNLLLAVVTLAYSKEHEKQNQFEEMRARAKLRAKRRAIRRQKLKEKAALALKSLTAKENESVTPVRSFGDLVARMKPISEQTISEQREDGSASVLGSMASGVDGSHSNITRGSNGAPKSKMEAFQTGRNELSLDSSESSKRTHSIWYRRYMRVRAWYLRTFCSWTCCPGFLTFQKHLQTVINHKLFETVIMLSIIINTLFLAIDHHGISPELNNALNVGNHVFTGIFTVEAIIKITALGVAGYAKELWNLFDFVIVFISLIEVGLSFSGGGESSAPDLTVLRTLRLLRVFRLARMWGTMHKLVSIIWKSVSAVSYLTIVLFLILYIFAVIGKQLYSKQYMASASRFEDNNIPRWSFIDFYHSFLLVWRVMCGEWIEPLYDCMYITNNDGLCIPLFLTITFVANFMILNLFTAILLEAFNVDNLAKGKREKENSEKLKRGIDVIRSKIKKKSQNVNPEQSMTDDQNKQDDTDSNKTESSSTSKQLLPPQMNTRRRESCSVNELFELPESSKIMTHKRKSEEKVNIVPKAKPRPKLAKQTSIRIDPDNSEVIELPRIIEEPSEEQTDVSNGAEHEMYHSSSNNIKKLQSNGIKHNLRNVKEKKAKVGCFPSCCCSCTDARENENIAVTIEGDAEEEEEEVVNPPGCLPEWFLKRYPSWKETPDTAPYRLWRNIRMCCYMLVKHKFFEWFILFLILSSTVCLAMEDIHLNSDPVRKLVLERLEYVFTALFTVEMVLKWLGIGPVKYFTSFWCVLDCAIVASSWIGIVLSQAAQFRSLRTLRALRPLRAISRWQGMKVVVNALIYCIPSIGNVLCVCLLIWMVFGIMGVQFFKGRFFKCVDADEEKVTDLRVVNYTTCIQYNYTWINPNINFDHVGNAMIALFQVATFEGWIEIMADASDIMGPQIQPRREASKYYLIYFVIFVLVGSFFILNLIVGVIIESFQKLRKQTDTSSAVEALLTDNQKNFYKTMRTMLNRKPKKTISPPRNRWQLRIFNLVTHSRFELAVFLLILMNMITLMMEHYKMSYEWTVALKYADISFTALFSIEAGLKLIGMRYHYFRDAFNVFDFIVILVSIIGFILENLVALIVSPTLLRIVRVFRVFRVLRVVRAARGIRRLILTLMISIPALFNIAVLLGVFIIIFAILGMTMFMNVKLNGALNDQVNFQTFGNSLMVLFRLVTSAGWNDVMDPLMNTRDCIPLTDNNPGNCGDPVAAVLYFVFYIFIIFLVIVNMYIAIILENFDEIFQQDECGVSQGDFETFYMVWGRYDPRATQFVTLTELSNLLHDLHPPFQLPKPNLVKIGALDLPVLYGDKVHCLDVLFALVKRILGEVEISADMKKEAEERLLKSFPNRSTLKAETTTLVLRQQIRAAKIIQDAWKSFARLRKEAGSSNGTKESSPTDKWDCVLKLEPRPTSTPALIGATDEFLTPEPIVKAENDAGNVEDKMEKITEEKTDTTEVLDVPSPSKSPLLPVNNANNNSNTTGAVPGPQVVPNVSSFPNRTIDKPIKVIENTHAFVSPNKSPNFSAFQSRPKTAADVRVRALVNTSRPKSAERVRMTDLATGPRAKQRVQNPRLAPQKQNFLKETTSFTSDASNFPAKTEKES
ncbi:sodium channel protein 1 brain-like [Ciona intestinalis]